MNTTDPDPNNGRSDDGDDGAVRLNLVQEWLNAYSNDQVLMQYQPIVDLASGHIVGFEALMRWAHPLLGLVPPKKFIPLAVDCGGAAQLGEFSLRRSVAAASTWPRDNAHGNAPFVSVNLSWIQLHDVNILSLIKECLQTSGLEPNHLMLEINSHYIMRDANATQEILGTLHELGVSVALDNFGEGFSSLADLSFVNPKVVKLSPMFLPPATGYERDLELLKSTIAMGHKLNTTFTAVGIESHDVVTRLQEVECEYGQGFFFSPAVPTSTAKTMVDVRFNV